MIPVRLKQTKIKFNEVPNQGLDYTFGSQTGELNGALLDLLGDFPNYEARVNIIPADQGIFVKGQTQGELPQLCARCAETFVRPFKKNFNVSFCKDEKHIQVFPDDLSELTGDFDVEFVPKGEIDLGEVIREQIALEIPFQPLCKPDCKGLCAQCGANKNISDCKCEVKNIEIVKPSSPFSVLKELQGD